VGSLFKKYFWIVILLANVATSFLLAKMTALFIAGQFPDQVLGGGAGSGLAVGTEGGPVRLVDGQVILKRNFFDPNETAVVSTDTQLDTESAESQTMDDPLTATAMKTALSIKLIATVSVGDGRNTLSSAVIESGKSADVYFVNGKTSFAPSTKVTRVLPKRVEFLNGGRLEYVELEDVTKTLAVTRTSKPTTVKKITEDEDKPAEVQGDGDKFTIQRAEVDKAVANLSKLYTDIRAVPYFKDGKANGFKLLSVKAGSLFEKLGLRRGDILKSLNGNTLDIQSGMTLFNSLKSESSFQLEIERRGTDKALSYDII
jgi:general secretion pathway protein C